MNSNQENIILGTLGNNIGNQAIIIAKLQAENSELKKLLAEANDQLEQKKTNKKKGSDA